MPFITQCPYEDCAKYLLLEDEAQGTTVKCLCCKKPVELMLELIEEEIVDLLPVDRSSQEPEAQSRFSVRDCPKCNQPIKIPPEKIRKAVSCLNCDFWGILW